MGKGRPAIYDRISQQQKFKLLFLVSHDGMSVKQAANSLKMNYSTAKTIMFLYRKYTSSNYSFYKSSLSSTNDQVRGKITALVIQGVSKAKIEVISSIGGTDKKVQDSFSPNFVEPVKLEESF